MPTPRKAYLSVVLGSSLLLAGVYVVGYTPGADSASRSKQSALAASLPQGNGPWLSEDLPLGDTETLRDQIENVLRFDDVLFRRYRNGEKEFSVYIAYWSPGSVTPREVEFHTPDRCWVHAGWKREDFDTSYKLQSDAGELQAGQWRVFSARNSTKQEVVFWHVVDRKVVAYEALDAPSDLSIVTDILRYGVAMKREQYFIRISSARPFDELKSDQFFKGLLTALRQYGINS